MMITVYFAILLTELICTLYLNSSQVTPSDTGVPANSQIETGLLPTDQGNISMMPLSEFENGTSLDPGTETPPGGLPGLICGDGSIPTLTGCADGSLPSLGKSGETPPGETPPGETPPRETLTEEAPPGETPPVGLPGLVCGDGSIPTLTGCADGSLPSLGKSGETPPGETPPGETPPVGLPGLVCGDGSIPTLTGCADGSLPSLGKSGETPPSGDIDKTKEVTKPCIRIPVPMGFPAPRCIPGTEVPSTPVNPALCNTPKIPYTPSSAPIWGFTYSLVQGKGLVMNNIKASG